MFSVGSTHGRSAAADRPMCRTRPIPPAAGRHNRGPDVTTVNRPPDPASGISCHQHLHLPRCARCWWQPLGTPGPPARLSPGPGSPPLERQPPTEFLPPFGLGTGGGPVAAALSTPPAPRSKDDPPMTEILMAIGRHGIGPAFALYITATTVAYWAETR